MDKHKAWATTIVAPKSVGSLTTKGQMKPTFTYDFSGQKILRKKSEPVVFVLVPSWNKYKISETVIAVTTNYSCSLQVGKNICCSCASQTKTKTIARTIP